MEGMKLLAASARNANFRQRSFLSFAGCIFLSVAPLFSFRVSLSFLKIGILAKLPSTQTKPVQQLSYRQ